MPEGKENKTKLLYDSVSSDYDIGTLEEFKAKLQDDNKRKALYDAIGEDYDLGTFEEFTSKVKKKDQPTQSSVSSQESIQQPKQPGEQLGQQAEAPSRDISEEPIDLQPEGFEAPETSVPEEGINTDEIEFAIQQQRFKDLSPEELALKIEQDRQGEAEENTLFKIGKQKGMSDVEAQIFSDSQKAGAIKRDEDERSAAKKAAEERKRVGFWEDKWGKLKSGTVSAAGGIAGIPALANKTAFILTAEMTGNQELLDKINKLPKEARDVLISGTSPGTAISYKIRDELSEISDEIREGTRQYEGSITNALINGRISDAVDMTVGSVTESLPYMAEAYVSLPLMGAAAAGEKMEEKEKQGVKLSKELVATSAIGGAAEAAFEKYTNKLINKTFKPIKKLVKGSKEASDEVAKSTIKRILKDAGIEGMTEAGTEATNQLSDKLFLGEEVDWKQIMDAAIIGKATGLGMSGLGAIIDKGVSPQYRVGEENISLDKMTEKIENAKSVADLEGVSIKFNQDLEQKLQDKYNEVKPKDENIEDAVQDEAAKKEEEGTQDEVASESPVEEQDISVDDKTSDITDADYKEFIDKGTVKESVISSIANKIKEGEKLTDKESAIYADKTSEVENKLKDKKTEKDANLQESESAEKTESKLDKPISAKEGVIEKKEAKSEDVTVEPKKGDTIVQELSTGKKVELTHDGESWTFKDSRGEIQKETPKKNKELTERWKKENYGKVEQTPQERGEQEDIQPRQEEGSDIKEAQKEDIVKPIDEVISSLMSKAAEVAPDKPVNERTDKEIREARKIIESEMPPIEEMTWEEYKPYGVAIQQQSSYGQPESFYERFAKMEYDNAILKKEAKEAKEAKEGPSKKEKSFSKQVMKDDRVSKEVKEGVKKEAESSPKKMTTTEAEAEQIMKDNDLDSATNEFMNPKSNIEEDVRVVLGQKLILKYNDQAVKSTNEKEKRKLYDKAITVANNLSEFHVKMGRANNAAKIYFNLSPEGQLIALQKGIAKERSKALKKDKDYIDSLESVIKNANKETVEEIIKNPKIKQAIEEIYGKSSKRGEKTNTKSKARKKRIVNQAVDFLDTLKIDTTGKAFDATYAIPVTVWNGSISVIQASLKAGLAVSEAISDAVEYINKNNKGAWNEDDFKREMNVKLNKFTALDDINKGDYAKGVTKGLKEVNSSINEIIKKHYTEQDKTKKQLIDKFIDELGLTEPEASTISSEIEKAFNELATKKKKQQLNKLLSPKDRLKIKETKKRKELQDEIIELSNMGALSNEEIQNSYAEKMDLPSISDEQAKTVMEMAEKAQTAKGNIAKNKAEKNLLSYHRKIKGINWSDIVTSLWYAHMLSGQTTQTLNIWANAAETSAEMAVSVIQNPANFPYIMKGLLSGYSKGWSDSKAIMTTKYGSVKGVKVEVPNVLEDIKFRGVKIGGKTIIPNPLNLSKYVGRIMDAADTFFYTGLKEARYHQLAAIEARKAGKENPDKKTYELVAEILHNNKESIEEAKLQALEEGYVNKSIPFKRRVNEIVDEQRNVDWAADVDDFASRGTFNYDPEGTIGLMSNQINSFIHKVPLARFIVPFTRILANVSNRVLDWSPYGMVRLAKGGIGWGDSKREFSKEERQRNAIKFTGGTLAMIALASLDSGEDDDSYIEITANGYGDRKKNYELAEKNGWREYSVRIGDTWYSYKNTPIAVGLAIIGQKNDSKRYLGEEDSSIGAAAIGVIKYIMSFSFMQGVADFTSMLSESSPSGSDASSADQIGKYFVRTSKALAVPNVITQTNRLYLEASKQPMRKAENWYEEYYKDIPYFNDDMMKIYNSLGDEVIPDMSERLIPFNMKKAESDKVYTLLQKNRVFVGAPSRFVTINGVKRKLEAREYNKYAMKSGRSIKKEIKEQYDRLKKMNPEDFENAIRDIKSRNRKRARNELFINK